MVRILFHKAHLRDILVKYTALQKWHDSAERKILLEFVHSLQDVWNTLPSWNIFMPKKLLENKFKSGAILLLKAIWATSLMKHHNKYSNPDVHPSYDVEADTQLRHYDVQADTQQRHYDVQADTQQRHFPPLKYPPKTLWIIIIKQAHIPYKGKMPAQW